ncbi:MAG: ATP-binding protein, partial [Nitrospirae bacterium]
MASLAKEALKDFSIVVITGARQVGKSTFLEKEFQGFKYVNLDEFDYLLQAKTDPEPLWIDSDRVIIDEAQRVPEIFPYIKATVDRAKGKKRFILSGSSNILLMKNISESLAGRAIYLEMFPMTVAEAEGISRPRNFQEILKGKTVKEQEPGEKEPIKYLLRGLMPPLLFIKNLRSILLWWEGYIKTYLERDLRELSQIDSLIDFRRVLEAIAPRTATVINQTDIARDTGVSQPTISRYLKLLEISNMVLKLPAFYTNRIKRIVKSPKLFFIDPALSVYLSGYHDRDSLKKSREIGQFFETLV